MLDRGTDQRVADAAALKNDFGEDAIREARSRRAEALYEGNHLEALRWDDAHRMLLAAL